MVEFIGLSFPFSSKLKIWSFYVVVVQGRQRNVQKKRETHADLLFSSLTLLRFWRSCCLRSRSFETSLTFLRRSETAPRRSRKLTLMRSVAEVNKQERGLEPTKTEVNFQKWELEFSAPHFHGQPRRHNVRCERLVPHRTVAVYALPDSFFVAPRKDIRYSTNIAKEKKQYLTASPANSVFPYFRSSLLSPRKKRILPSSHRALRLFWGDCFRSVWWKHEFYLKFRRNVCLWMRCGGKVGLSVISHLSLIG